MYKSEGGIRRQIPLSIQTPEDDIEPKEVKLTNESSRKTASESVSARTANRHR